MSEDENKPVDTGRSGVERSPNYPSIPLTQAVELAQKWYEREKRTTVSAEVAAKALGYSSLSGRARTNIASLRQYGLVETVKDGMRITDLAMEILHQPIGSPERTNALRVAALNPALIVELRDTHSDASDDALRGYLVTKRKFSPDGASRFIPAFREAVQIGRLEAPGDSNEGKRREAVDQSRGPGWVESNRVKAPAQSGEIMNFTWDLGGDVVASMTVSKNIGMDDIKALELGLESMKVAVMKQAKLNASKSLAAPAGAQDAS